MRAIVILLAVLVAGPAPARAQPDDSLLASRADAGDRITIVSTSGARLSGRLVADTSGALTIRTNTGEQRIVHAYVARVDRRRNRFLFGPLIGVAAGLALGLPLKRRFDNEGGNGNAWLGMSVGLGFGVGSFAAARGCRLAAPRACTRRLRATPCGCWCQRVRSWYPRGKEP